MRSWLIAAGGLLSLALLGCGQAPESPEVVGPPPTFTVDEANPVQAEPPIDVMPIRLPINPAYMPLVEYAQQDLAARLGLSVADIQPLEVQAVVWPDHGLGCPDPAMGYIQVPEDGALIRLAVGAKIFEYHSGASRPPFLCEQPQPSPGTPPGDTLQPPPRLGG
jgi:hypothetical protein